MKTFYNGMLVEEYLLENNLYIKYDSKGEIEFNRTLTAEEIMWLTPPQPTPVPSADALDAAALMAEQSLISDVRDLAVPLKNAADALRSA